ncbi:hypothetical protein M153_2930006031 [Pseudoloma neurophilia]|uniref:Uncharacterized protein n=1 Tax=Pseudoloma neurophilia TaxID=146866 RepID=A0A0R0LYH9_9MICR|nr:hypothetical protein M153_2930006031 [Pseudoloma neurophilia]
MRNFLIATHLFRLEALPHYSVNNPVIFLDDIDSLSNLFRKFKKCGKEPLLMQHLMTLIPIDVKCFLLTNKTYNFLYQISHCSDDSKKKFIRDLSHLLLPLTNLSRQCGRMLVYTRRGHVKMTKNEIWRMVSSQKLCLTDLENLKISEYKENFDQLDTSSKTEDFTSEKNNDRCTLCNLLKKDIKEVVPCTNIEEIGKVSQKEGFLPLVIYDVRKIEVDHEKNTFDKQKPFSSFSDDKLAHLKRTNDLLWKSYVLDKVVTKKV